MLLAYSAAHLTWQLIPLPPQQAAPMAPRSSSGGPARADAVALSREIVSRHLFGQAQAESAPTNKTAIPETSLRLTLRGVMASSDPNTATAIVADPGGKEDFYTVGQDMPGGAVLKEVHAQHIVISRGGRFETLRLPEDSLKVNSNVETSPDAESLSPSPQASALLERYRNQFVQDPQTLANLLQGEPYWENGRLIGYRLRPGRDAGVLSQFGIQSGDVVTAINGVSLVDPSGRMQLLRTITEATEFNVDLLRSGQPYTISIPVGKQG